MGLPEGREPPGRKVARQENPGRTGHGSDHYPGETFEDKKNWPKEMVEIVDLEKYVVLLKNKHFTRAVFLV